ncbi:hypothetical protein CPB85DRAFT_1337748 [Mucidula mucida]|nr:hypothetical protein CPB85DRAFT_1337748 [Mucidula mucida]
MHMDRRTRGMGLQSLGAPRYSDCWVALVAMTVVLKAVDRLLKDPHICRLYKVSGRIRPLSIPTLSSLRPVSFSQSFDALPLPEICRARPTPLRIGAPCPCSRGNRSVLASCEVQGTPPLHPTILRQRRDFLRCQYTHTFAMSNAAVRPVSTHEHVVVHDL